MIKRADILEALEPLARAKVYNPNGSTKPHTSRVINMRLDDIARLKVLYDRLLLEELQCDEVSLTLGS